MDKLSLWMSGFSTLCGFISVGFWMRSAGTKLPNQDKNQKPTSPVGILELYQTCMEGARINKIAAGWTGAAVLLAALATGLPPFLVWHSSGRDERLASNQSIPAGFPQIIAFRLVRIESVSSGGELVSGVLSYKDGSKKNGKCALPFASSGEEPQNIPLWLACAPDKAAN